MTRVCAHFRVTISRGLSINAKREHVSFLVARAHFIAPLPARGPRRARPRTPPTSGTRARERAIYRGHGGIEGARAARIGQLQRFALAAENSLGRQGSAI